MDAAIKGKLVDIHAQKIYPATLIHNNGIIESVHVLPPGVSVPDIYILPGFIDAHVHIESSMLVPAEFARLAVVHGTVATVSDPHEIANVCGIQGVDFMIENSRTVPFKFFFGAPSCVPATVFETAGAALPLADVSALLRRKEIRYLSEMMNFPGVLAGEPEVMGKIAAARREGKPVDGHAPGLRGEDARKYIEAGITTDHECFTREEALDKLSHGMKIIIREGSAAKNFDALAGLLDDHADHMMFCSDDKHPDSLVEGHINQLCARAVASGINLFKVLGAACLNPVGHYNLDVGLLRPGDPADFILVKDLVCFEVLQTWIGGVQVSDGAQSLIARAGPGTAGINHFHCRPKSVSDMAFPARSPSEGLYEPMTVIEALDGQLITNKWNGRVKKVNGNLESNLEEDILKLVVVNRYRDAPLAKAFIRNFGLKQGALASSVAHDSHNIVAIGTDDESLCRAINLVIAEKGGISCTGNGQDMVLALPVAGLMSSEDGYAVAEKYARIDRMAKNLGSRLSSPYMTLSFMALLVIPHLKLSDLGLFDGDRFSFFKNTAG
jgi:adenine deaminase